MKHFNAIQDNKILAFSKLKAFADDEFNGVVSNGAILPDMFENIVGKGENAGRVCENLGLIRKGLIHHLHMFSIWTSLTLYHKSQTRSAQ